jgi:hypothetical protein
MNFICFHIDAARPGLLRCVTRECPSRFQSFYVMSLRGKPHQIPCEIHVAACPAKTDDCFIVEDCVFAPLSSPLLFPDISSAKCAPFGVPLSVRGDFRCFFGKYVADQHAWCLVDPDSTQTNAAAAPPRNALESFVLERGARGSVVLKRGALHAAQPSLPESLEAYSACCLKFIYVDKAQKVGLETFYMCPKRHRCDNPLHCPKCDEVFERGSMRTVRLARYKLSDSNGDSCEMDMWRPPRLGDPLLLARNGWGFTVLLP